MFAVQPPVPSSYLIAEIAGITGRALLCFLRCRKFSQECFQGI